MYEMLSILNDNAFYEAAYTCERKKKCLCFDRKKSLANLSILEDSQEQSQKLENILKVVGFILIMVTAGYMSISVVFAYTKLKMLIQP